MPARFKPLPVLSVLTCGTLALLVALGIWQARRAIWKSGLIAEYQTQLDKPPATSLEDALCQKNPSLIPIQLVETQIMSEHQPLQLFGRGADQQTGWRLLSVVSAPECLGKSALMLAETGFQPAHNDNSSTAITSLLVTAWPKKPLVAATNNAPNNQWYWLDAKLIIETLGLKPGQLITRTYLTSSARRPLWLTRTPPVRHVAYSATWFLLAVAVICIYVMYHVRTGRLDTIS